MTLAWFFFLNMTPKEEATKAKIELHQTKNLLHIKEHSQQSVKITYERGENIFKPYI